MTTSPPGSTSTVHPSPTDAAEGPPGKDLDPANRSRSDRLAWWTFAALVVAAVPLLLWLGSYRWFLGDEWTFLSDRSMTPDDLGRPSNLHWSTTLVVIYRGLYALVGLHHYWPYQLVVIVAHLGIAVLIRFIARRSGVDPWIATVVAGSFVLLGAAEDNILWGIQIGLTLTLVAGMSQVILADHDGSISRRDVVGLVLGALALITSGNAVALIAATGLVCVIRRRWLAAAFHTVPLAVIYLIWSMWYDLRALYADVVGLADEPMGPGDLVTWIGDAAVGLVLGIGVFPAVAFAIALGIVGGLIVAVRQEGLDAFSRRAAVPVALTLAVAVAMTTVAPSRFFLPGEPARASRYVGLMAALSLPLVAVALDALVRRWPRALVPILALLLLPIPFNVARFGDDELLTPSTFAMMKTYITTLPHHPLTQQTPPWVRPDDQSVLGFPDMTIGWLLAADREGKVPDPVEPLHPLTETLLPIQLGVAVIDDELPPDPTCEDVGNELILHPEVGDRLHLPDGAKVAPRYDDQTVPLPIEFGATTVEITLPDLELSFAPRTAGESLTICR